MKSFILWMSLFASLLANAQTARVSYSPKFSLKDPGRALIDPDAKVGDSWYSVEASNHDFRVGFMLKLTDVKFNISVRRFDSAGNMLKEVLVRDDKTLGPFPPKAVIFRHQLVVFYYKSMGDRSIHLFVSVYDPLTLEERSNNDLYGILERNVSYLTIEEAAAANKLLMYVSSEGDKLLVSQSGNTKEVFSCVIDDQLKVSGKVISKSRGESVSVDDGVINQDGIRAFTLSYKENKERNTSILVISADNKETILPYSTLKGSADKVNALRVIASRDHSKFFVFGTYGVGRRETKGVLLAPVLSGGYPATLGDPVLSAYPPALIGKLKKRDYSDGKTVDMATFYGLELEDGTIALSGCVEYNETGYGQKAGLISTTQFGPIINLFIKEGDTKWAVVYRNQKGYSSAQFEMYPFHGKLLLLHWQSRKNLASKDPSDLSKLASIDELVFTQAMIGSDGSIAYQPIEIADDRGADIWFGARQKGSGISLFIPRGHSKLNIALSRYIDEFRQWVRVELK